MANPLKKKQKIESEYDSVIKMTRNASQMRNYCEYGEASEMPTSLGLRIEKFGPVSFPLYEPLASSLLLNCQQSLFRKNVYIKSESSTYYELDASKVTIANPEWDKKLGELVKRVGEGLSYLFSLTFKWNKPLFFFISIVFVFV